MNNFFWNSESLSQSSLHDRYEELRMSGLESSYVSTQRGFGLTLFLNQGMVAWIKALHVTPPLPTVNTSQPEMISTVESSSFKHQLASLLAGLALNSYSNEDCV